MQHLTTRTPPSVQFQVQPSPFCGYLATAVDTATGRQSGEVWGPSELDARQRAEALVSLGEAQVCEQVNS